jgi:hypothetical protein
MHSDHFAMPATKGIIMLAISWTLSLWSKYSLRLDLHQLLIHITPSELVGVLSGLGSFGLSIITAWHYLSKIRDMKKKDKENKNDKTGTDENGKG